MVTMALAAGGPSPQRAVTFPLDVNPAGPRAGSQTLSRSRRLTEPSTGNAEKTGTQRHDHVVALGLRRINGSSDPALFSAPPRRSKSERSPHRSSFPTFLLLLQIIFGRHALILHNQVLRITSSANLRAQTACG